MLRYQRKGPLILPYTYIHTVSADRLLLFQSLLIVTQFNKYAFSGYLYTVSLLFCIRSSRIFYY